MDSHVHAMFGKFFQRRGAKAVSFEFTFAVDSISSQASDGLELGKSFSICIEKGDKNIKSGDHKSFLQGSEIVVTVNEKLNMSVTLYENSDGKYQEKLATILLRQRRAGAAGLKNGNDAFITVGTIPLQLESYANMTESKVSLPLQLCSFDGCMVNMSITSRNSSNSSNSQTPSKSPSPKKEKSSTKSKAAVPANNSAVATKSGTSTQTKESTPVIPTKNTFDNFDDFDTTSNKNTDPFDATIQRSSLSDKNPFDEDDKDGNPFDEDDKDENPFSNPTVSTDNNKTKTAEIISNSVNNNSIAHALSQLRDSEKQVNMLQKENKQIKEDLDALKSKNDWNVSEISRLEELVEMLQNENRALKSQPSSGKPNHAMKSLLQKYSTHIAKLELKLVEVSLQKV